MLWVGNGPGEGGCLLHNTRYDFNDSALPVGVSFFVRLAERFLAKQDCRARTAGSQPGAIRRPIAAWMAGYARYDRRRYEMKGKQR